MSRHTVGPWEYDPESGDIIAPKCGYQWQKGAPVIATIGHLDYAEDDANARLIAAAPDLLEALRDMLAGWKYIRSFHGDLYGVGWDRAQDKAEAAIAAAKGEA